MASPSQYRIWWLNPGWIFILALLPFAVAAYLISDEDFMLYWRMNRFFDEQDLLYVFAVTAAFLGGGYFSRKFSIGPAHVEWGKFSPRELDFLLRLFRFGAALTFVGYVIWFIVAVRNGMSLSLIIDGLVGKGGAAYESKGLMTTVPGVTTATQFGMAVFILGTILMFNGKTKKVAGWLAVLLFLTFARSILNSERLAIVEVAMPVVCLTAYYCREKFRTYLYGFPSIMWPIAGVILLYLLFTGSEYGRAWTTFYQDEGGYDSVWEFSLMRLIGYYVTALNNGALIYRALGVDGIPTATFQWFFKFPLVGPWVYAELAPNSQASSADVLISAANPEFNNYSTVYGYALDWGEIGATVFFFLLGMFIFNFYRRFTKGNAAGILIYPLLYVGILEIARSTYWTSSRVFPSWVLLLIAIYGLNGIRKRQGIAEQREVINTNLSQTSPLVEAPG